MSTNQSEKNTSEKFHECPCLQHRYSDHRCFRCRRFYGRCRCHRQMYRFYRTGCGCRMILKAMLILLAMYLVYRLMKSSEEETRVVVF